MRDSRIEIISRHAGEITVSLPYNPTYIKRLKDIEGHRWNPEQKCWVFPHSDNVVKKLLALFKDEDIWIDPSLRQKVGQTFYGRKESCYFNLELCYQCPKVLLRHCLETQFVLRDKVTAKR